MEGRAVSVQGDPTGSVDNGRTRVITWEDPLLTAAAARERSGLELIQAMASGVVPPPPVANTIGGRLDSVAEGEVVFSFEPAEFHYNPIGTVHGGVYSTLLDSAMGCAVHTLLPVNVGYTSLDLSVRFLGAMRVGTGRVTCTGTVVHLGRRTALAEARIETDTGKLLATATSSCLVLTP
jgi:uncharacterized protein (TIGR00369 family)